jgi:hypothetical protein
MPTVKRLVLIYNADWSLLGGLKYAAHRLKTGEDPCALCALTYDGVSENKAWKSCRLEFGVPVDAVYKNKVSDAMAAAAGHNYPCVLAETESGFTAIAAHDAFSGCLEARDQVSCLAELLRAGLARAGLELSADSLGAEAH